jgi:hypothetical protein
MVNKDLERILCWSFDGEEPNRDFMILMCLVSNADRLRESDCADTCRLVVLEPSVIGSDEVEEPLAFVVEACL